MAIVGSFTEAWQQFLGLEAVVLNEEARWRSARGRAMLLAFIVPVGDSPLADAIETVQARLADLPYIEPSPRELLHITVKLGGFQVVMQTMDDDIIRSKLPAIASAADSILSTTPVFTADVGQVNAFPDAIFLEVEDYGHLKELHLRFCEEIAGLYLYPTEAENYLPHITIARFRSQEQLPQVKERLQALRREWMKLGELTIDCVDLSRIILATDPPEIQVLQTTHLRDASF